MAIVAMVLCFCSTPNEAKQAQPDQLDPAAKVALQSGREALASRRYEEAAKAFRKANKIQHERCYPCWMELAVVLANLGDVKTALSSADKAMALASTDQERAASHSLRGYVLSGMNNEDRNRQKLLKEQESEFRKAIELDQGNAEYHLRLGVVLMKELQDEQGKEEVGEYLKLEPSGRYADYARKLKENPLRAREDFAPEFSITTIQGESISLEQLKGRFVVLDFWATWCPPCRDSVGDLKDLTKKYAPDKVFLISVSADSDEAQWRDFVRKKDMAWAQYRDSRGDIQKSFAVRAFPTYIVIDPEGIIRERIVGENPQQSVAYRLRDALKVLTAAKGQQ